MSDIVCNACTIKVPEEKEAGVAFRAGTDETVDLHEVLSAGMSQGLTPNVVVAYLNEGESHKLLPQFDFRLVKKVVETEMEKVFDGDAAQAEEAGWQENEFGWVCPDCSDTAHTTEDSSAGAEGDDLMTQVAVLAAVGPETLKKVKGRGLRERLASLVVQEAEEQGLEVVSDE